jgi:uncharacterized cupredoxin-like copper-binding protein
MRTRVVGLSIVGLACAGLLAVVFGYLTAPAASQKRAAGATVVTVTAGKPSELAFKLSRSSTPPWQGASRSETVAFKVRNGGALAHAFKVCTTPVENANRNTCSGTGTAVIKPGQSTTLTITFRKSGTYQYLSSVPGQAAKGMKGLIGIGVTLPNATSATPGTTSTTPSTTKPSTTTPAMTAPPPTTTPSSPAPTGAAAAGAAVWVSAGCGDCHALSDVRGNVGPDLNLTHPGPFSNGALTPTQISDLVAYINSR